MFTALNPIDLIRDVTCDHWNLRKYHVFSNIRTTGNITKSRWMSLRTGTNPSTDVVQVRYSVFLT